MFSVRLENYKFTLVIPISLKSGVPILVFSLPVLHSHSLTVRNLVPVILILPLSDQPLFCCLCSLLQRTGAPLGPWALAPCLGLPCSAPCPPCPTQASTYHTRQLPTSLVGTTLLTPLRLIPAYPSPKWTPSLPLLQIHARDRCSYSAWALSAYKRPPSVPPQAFEA